ncbi:protein EXORDIUM-like 1 [Euphorbia lathyris]|uniref:protein EXORDIUM-like 1 n=1 Tax=Euphorbia lathyris TaxID=212925 RepID=UPI003314011B
MANLFSLEIHFYLLLLLSFTEIITSESVPKEELVQSVNLPTMPYHKGPLLNGKISINLIWYGQFTPAQRAIVTDFITSIDKPSKVREDQPDVVTWWKKIQAYYKVAKKTYSLTLSLGTQINDEKYSLGKKLSDAQIKELAAKGAQSDAINVVLTSADVSVDKFCIWCGKHGFTAGNGTKSKYAYIWVGNPQTQCPGECAWPFYKGPYGPTTPAISPNKDKGMEGVIINLSTELAGTATNPFGDGFYHAPKEAPLEAGTACNSIFARGAHPGFPGDLLVEVNTGASYNAQGVNGRKYLLPAIANPKGDYCSTLV